MTFNELRDTLANLDEEQLDMSFTVCVDDEFYGIYEMFDHDGTLVIDDDIMYEYMYEYEPLITFRELVEFLNTFNTIEGSRVELYDQLYWVTRVAITAEDDVLDANHPYLVLERLV